MNNYDSFATSATQRQWKQIGLKRRAGVCSPLFSLFSNQSLGIGEIPDLKLLVDWVKSAGMSIIQLLPLNDVGFNFRPYDSQSSFALEPMYLSLTELVDVKTAVFEKEIAALRKEFPTGKERVDYGIKSAKLELLWKMFKHSKKKLPPAFERYREENAFWLDDYAVFRTIKEKQEERHWETWPPALREKRADEVAEFVRTNADQVQFQKWLQWQLFEQFRPVRDHCRAQGVFLMGDLPFLVSHDSADVWSHQNYFKLGLASGAPPDAYCAKGQRWGMPPYDWDQIAAGRYDYLIQKLKYAEKFYDLYRMDHFIGIFRVWTIQQTEPLENAGLNGVFDPPDEKVWEEHGTKILNVMLENASMLPCAEDLGVVPDCSWRVLETYGVPGMDIQRWMRFWNTTGEFKPPEAYRKHSIAAVSTHDMLPLRGWWEFEAGTVDEGWFVKKCREKGIAAEQLKPALFDVKKSQAGRLRWKKSLESKEVLLEALQLDENAAYDFLEAFRNSRTEREQFWHYAGLKGKPTEKTTMAFVSRTLAKANESASIFSIQMLQDWLSLDETIEYDPLEFRINFPGSTDPKNWSLVMPLSLEQMLQWPLNPSVERINRDSGRH